jgi:hypothetical protein
VGVGGWGGDGDGRVTEGRQVGKRPNVFGMNFIRSRQRSMSPSHQQKMTIVVTPLKMMSIAEIHRNKRGFFFVTSFQVSGKALKVPFSILDELIDDHVQFGVMWQHHENIRGVEFTV